MAVLKTAAFALILCCVTVFADDPKVLIIATDPPEDPIANAVIQEKDKDVQLTCAVENVPVGTDVQWMLTSLRKDSSIVQISTATRTYDAFRWAIDRPADTSWRLRIQNAQVVDEGKYYCQVQIVSMSYISAIKEVRIVQKPQISDLITSSDMTKNTDDPASLECYAEGRPTPLIKWTRMAGGLLPNGGTEFQGNVLSINRIQSDHAGIYKCSASNSAGLEERIIRVTVNFRPEVYTSTSVVSQAIGYQKQLICNIKGYPPPTSQQISWDKEGRPIISDERVQIRNIPGASNRITSILDIRRVSSEDFGRYSCSATNDKGSRAVTMEFQQSSVPTGQIAGGSAVTLNIVTVVATIVMLISVCMLQ